MFMEIGRFSTCILGLKYSKWGCKIGELEQSSSSITMAGWSLAPHLVFMKLSALMLARPAMLQLISGLDE